MERSLSQPNSSPRLLQIISGVIKKKEGNLIGHHSMQGGQSVSPAALVCMMREETMQGHSRERTHTESSSMGQRKGVEIKKESGGKSN